MSRIEKDQNVSDEGLIKYGLDPKKLPKHVAIIMDGNGRWAAKRMKPRQFGHKEGAEALRRTIKAFVEFGIKYLSVYVFSTENWKRPDKEVSFLMEFSKKLLIREFEELNRAGVYIKCLGNISGLNKELSNLMNDTEQKTKNNKILQLNLMFNYGSRYEIIQACKQLIENSSKKDLDKLDEEIFSRFLYTTGVPDPDILIRTGGNFRISNFLLWQIAYTEMFFLDLLWPDFNKEILLDVIRSFQKRNRRFGGLNSC